MKKFVGYISAFLMFASISGCASTAPREIVIVRGGGVYEYRYKLYDIDSLVVKVREGRRSGTLLSGQFDVYCVSTVEDFVASLKLKDKAMVNVHHKDGSDEIVDCKRN